MRGGGAHGCVKLTTAIGGDGSGGDDVEGGVPPEPDPNGDAARSGTTGGHGSVRPVGGGGMGGNFTAGGAGAGGDD
eukprot:26895-Eustigmatos_ZCMA.PRE.1